MPMLAYVTMSDDYCQQLKVYLNLSFISEPIFKV